MVSLTAKISEKEHEKFLEVAKQYGCANNYQFMQFIVQNVISGEMTIVKGTGELRLKAIQSDEMIKGLNEELQKAKTILVEAAYNRGYTDAETNFKKKSGAVGMKAEFYDSHIGNSTNCGTFGTCLFSKKGTKEAINHIKTIDNYEKRNAN